MFRSGHVTPSSVRTESPTTSPNILPGNAGSRRQIARGERSREPGKNAHLGLGLTYDYRFENVTSILWRRHRNFM